MDERVSKDGASVNAPVVSHFIIINETLPPSSAGSSRRRLRAEYKQ